jgi:hypothetical protein
MEPISKARITHNNPKDKEPQEVKEGAKEGITEGRNVKRER